MATWVGIDIGASAVKAAVIRTAYRKTSLSAVAIVDLAEAGGVALAIKAAVTLAMGGRGGTGDAVATSIEGSRAAVRTVALPKGVHKQIGDVLPFELESLTPFDLSESVFDYRLLSPDAATHKGEELSVLVGVARIAEVRARIDLVKEAIGVEPERVGLGAFPISSLLGVVPQLAEPGPVMVVDLGTRSSDVLILRGGEPVFARTLSLGTEGLPGSAPRLARELRVTVSAYRAAGGTAPSRVLLCGGGAFVSGAEAFLAGELELPVESFPMPNLDVTALSQEQLHALPRFAKAIGLALGLGLGGRSAALNLRKGPLAFERGFAWVKEKVPLLAGLSAVILVSFLFSAWAQLYSRGKEHVTLEKALAAVTKEVLGEETSSAQRANELLAQQTTITDEDPLPHADAFDVIVKLSEDIPQSMVHDIEELDVQKGHVVVHGVVGSIPDAQAIATSLRNEPCFADVKITRTNQVVGGERQKYVLEFDLKCAEDQKGKKPAAHAATSASASTPATTGGK